MNIEVNKVTIFVTVPIENTQEVRDAVCKAVHGAPPRFCQQAEPLGRQKERDA